MLVNKASSSEEKLQRIEIHSSIKSMIIKQTTFLFFLSLWVVQAAFSQKIYAPDQPLSGPGGADYSHAEVVMHDFAEAADGYWLFEPAAPVPQTAPVVVFCHGYGAYNPMIYGQWIKHLVRKGNIVVFPRYQENLFFPRPPAFSGNVASAIRQAQEEMASRQHIQPQWDQLAFVAHSYGGVICADLAVNFAAYKIPKPLAGFLCSPGTGPLNGGRLKTYAEIPEDFQLLVIVSEQDPIVGDEFGLKVFNTATKVKRRNFIRQHSDTYGWPAITAGHNEPYALEEQFDTGVRNYSANKALRVAKVNPIDYSGYWKLADALLDCSRSGNHCQYAFGNTPEQRSLGLWSDGKPVRELEVILPNLPPEN